MANQTSASDKLIKDLVQEFLRQLKTELQPIILAIVADSVKKDTELGRAQAATLAQLGEQQQAVAQATKHALLTAAEAALQLETLRSTREEHQRSVASAKQQLEACSAALETLPAQLEQRMLDVVATVEEQTLQPWLSAMREANRNWKEILTEVKAERAEIFLGRAAIDQAKTELAGIKQEVVQLKEQARSVVASLQRELEGSAAMRGTVRRVKRAAKTLGDALREVGTTNPLRNADGEGE